MNKKTFNAIDFETAQGYHHSICQVGIVRVVNGVIEDTVNQLIQPPQNYYWRQHIQIHGISSRDTLHAPTFEEAWPKLKPYIENQTLVAHNGRFDFSCLRKTLAYYKLDVPEFNPACTYKIYRKPLAHLCKEYGINLKHHDALSDSLACAKLYLNSLNLTLMN